ncbi:MAG: hypothetical protein JSS07_07490 [Proteobacteria bacterium]|nr:hypothetical protein [Pseudomonadota bacterium]
MLHSQFPNQPILTVRIDASSWHEAGKQYYNQIGADKLLAQKKLMDNILEPKTLFNKLQFKFQKDLTVEALQFLNASEINDFILGGLESNAVREANLTEFDLQYLNSPYLLIRLSYLLAKSDESGFSCSFGAYSDEQGTTILRNFDFVGVKNNQNFPKIHTTYPIETYLKINDPKYPNTIFMPGAVGIISNITIANDKGIFQEINSNDNVKHPLDFAAFTRKTIMSLLVVEMTKLSSFDEATSWASTIATDTAIFLNITGPNKGEILSLDMLPFDKAKNSKNGFINIPRIPKARSTKTPYFDHNEQILVCTNDERQIDELSIHTNGESIEESGFFSEQRYLNLILQLRNNIEALQVNQLDTMQKIAEKSLSQKHNGVTVEYPLDELYQSNGITCRTTLLFSGPNKVEGRWRAQQFTDLQNKSSSSLSSTWTEWHTFKLK